MPQKKIKNNHKTQRIVFETHHKLKPQNNNYNHELKMIRQQTPHTEP